MTMNPPPPMPQEYGRTTESVKDAATAASMALPPSLSMRAPASDATGWSHATAPEGKAYSVGAAEWVFGGAAAGGAAQAEQMTTRGAARRKRIILVLLE